jgi:fumarylacetoacetase
LDPSDARLTSFVEGAAGSSFPIQNLPYGMFSTEADPVARIGVAIGDRILDLPAVAAAGALELDPRDRHAFDEPGFSGLFAVRRDGWRRVRARISALLRAENPRLRDDAALRERALVAASRATLHLPVVPAGFTDFYSSREHATNVGKLFRDPEHALLPNWLELPVAYNGRASSVVASGTPVRRPSGQMRATGAERPVFGPSRQLDFELEVAFVVGEGNALGHPIAVDDAEDHIFGLVLLNDWSARDIQQWEYQPLGPFNGKSFATSISPWIVTLDALEPFRIPGPPQNPEPLEYLRERNRRGFNLALEVALSHDGASKSSTVTRSNFKHVYWSIAQQLAHHTISGCNTRPTDLMASGTVSGPDTASLGSLLEITEDEVIMTGFCDGPDYRVGFGELRGRVVAGEIDPRGVK